MKRSILIRPRPLSGRRGVTLVEMLVTVAVLVIIMTVLVQVFQGATGALSAAQASQQIDDQLRRVDGLIHSDLEGVTARFTPPLDPAQNLGYFEYGENEFADVQGEDSDDYVRFTAKAPEGRPFTGRMWIPSNNLANTNTLPITVTSDYAEIIYFLRNGNLYRRVLLIAPELQSVIFQGASTINPLSNLTFTPNLLGSPVSWQGVNDLSARPPVSGNASQNNSQNIVLNTLGDLTNRENRFASPRFSDDFATIVGGANGASPTFVAGPDGISDDQNSDNVADYYPTIYSGVFPAAAGGAGNAQGPLNSQGNQITLIYEPYYGNVPRSHLGLMGFPFVFPGAYSFAQVLASDKYGWIHAPAPYALAPQGNATCSATQFDGAPGAYLQSMNHNPIDLGDNLPTLANAGGLNGKSEAAFQQTWWGFPTWRETLSPNWQDPTIEINVALSQPYGLVPLTSAQVTSFTSVFAPGTNNPNPNLLPPMVANYTYGNATTLNLRTSDQYMNDGAGSASLFLLDGTANQNPNPTLWNRSWEDDLIMTNVRSFDVKAYENSFAGFADLGWGDDVRFSGNVLTPLAAAGSFLAGNADYSGNNLYPPLVGIQGTPFDFINQTFAHEGRMPPLVEDNRLDAQYPNPSYIAFNNFVAQYSNFPNYSSNIGDDAGGGTGNNSTGLVRLRRVWDSWSIKYSRAPANGVYNNPGNGADPLNGSPWGPLGGSPPIYPSYPPPYPAPLRGIQIQIRVTDPTNQRIKSLTIRQDFTDKL